MPSNKYLPKASFEGTDGVVSRMTTPSALSKVASQLLS